MPLKKENILIVDDNYDMLELLHRNLKALDFHTYKASSVEEAYAVLQESPIDLLITDLQMPEKSGLELLLHAKEHFPETPTLVITGFPTIDSAVQSTKLGAQEYLIKPFTSDELRKAIQTALPTQRKTLEAKSAESKVQVMQYSGMVGSSPNFHQLIDTIERVKDNRATVLIKGESGTGKELIARAIHYGGAFSKMPFVAVNCGALPENLIESELFGHVKGAFSGANETKMGLFEAADSGTIFLDEIGTLPLGAQTRLLRVLQDKEIRKVGAHHPQKINLRIISATNADIPDLVSKGLFREDLYYRLNVVTIDSVALRHRKQDIAPLSQLFLSKYGSEYGKPEIAISDKAMQALKAYHWPGNVRELENLLQRLIILSDATIEVKDIPSALTDAGRPSCEDGVLLSLRDAEVAHIRKVLAAVGNNKTKAAEILQIDRKTLRIKLS
ncbi:sigma-54-dependent transcriptional regulator [Flavobacterium selenitireducens]|uniref:sigma-54-dependent transcriptional regulator n=1 Tax=Flavobacterium selenitireducens TaxID=2722704 RepID=UPI00168AD78E|nr:sigma-54 dependent transcriptional regulator [Flavobacterium selenitireducens]MBD3581254.1 sigma-54-dependent Fis family transcriptional regulator [Flavobacterium selenitireducens]